MKRTITDRGLEMSQDMYCEEATLTKSSLGSNYKFLAHHSYSNYISEIVTLVAFSECCLFIYVSNSVINVQLHKLFHTDLNELQLTLIEGQDCACSADMYPGCGWQLRVFGR